MQQYTSQVEEVLNSGKDFYDERTGKWCRKIFGMQRRYDLAKSFPLESAKFTPWKITLSELLWFIKGGTNIRDLHEFNNHIWDAWADENGYLGPIYGKQWRKWQRAVITSPAEEVLSYDNEKPNLTLFTGADGYFEEVDQLQIAINTIKSRPSDRGIIVSAWNVADLPDMALRPCHTMFQFDVCDGKLNSMLYQRSADLPIGVPVNIASYSMLTHMVAHVCKLSVGEFVHTIGNAHIYHDQIPGVEEMLARPPIDEQTQFAITREVTNINDFVMSDFALTGYVSHPKIIIPVAV